MQMLSVPGKVLIYGSYSVLLIGNIALSFAVTDLKGKGVTSYFTTGKRRIVSAQFDIDIEPQFEGFIKRNILVEYAYVIAELYLREKKLWKKDVFINLMNSQIFGSIHGKSGLGSSAAVVIAVIRSVFMGNGLSFKDYVDVIHKLGQITNALYTRKVSSGFDIATCAHDTSILYKRFNPDIIKLYEENGYTQEILREMVLLADNDWPEMHVKQFIVPSDISILYFNIIDRKTDTIESVKKVYAWRTMNKEKFNEMMRNLNALDENVINSLKERKYNEVKELTHKIRTEFKELQRNMREELKINDDITYIEPPVIGRIIDEVENAFPEEVIAGRVPGAGGWDGFCFLVLKSDWEPIINKTIDLCKHNGLTVEYIPLRII
ncbi:MAG: hypothetical protein N3E37_01035 [Candidatus Micrarchaeota archaeon]|nr:hypothetical protein [Candidatus Micrarchaeota archaeon]